MEWNYACLHRGLEGVYGDGGLIRKSGLVEKTRF